MKFGKLTTNELNDNVIRLLNHTRKEVLASAKIGEDCAALDLSGIILVSSDPITAQMEIEKIGALCVSVCCNDVSANGGQPIAMTLTLLMPPTCDANDVGVIMKGASAKASELGVDIVGGHTEFTDCVTRPVISGTVIGKAKKLLLKGNLKVGDKLLVTKDLAMEGTCILANRAQIQFTESDKSTLVKMSESLDVDRESKILSDLDCISAMHDVTEGGILGAVAEICINAGVGAVIEENLMPVNELTKKVCENLNVNYLRLISSGSMLIATSDEQTVKRALLDANIKVTCIGQVTEKDVTLEKTDGSKEEIEILPDELYRF
jgi:hydrogenase expression/formation protein HypE